MVVKCVPLVNTFSSWAVSCTGESNLFLTSVLTNAAYSSPLLRFLKLNMMHILYVSFPILAEFCVSLVFTSQRCVGRKVLFSTSLNGPISPLWLSQPIQGLQWQEVKVRAQHNKRDFNYSREHKRAEPWENIDSVSVLKQLLHKSAKTSSYPDQGAFTLQITVWCRDTWASFERGSSSSGSSLASAAQVSQAKEQGKFAGAKFCCSGTSVFRQLL